MHNSILEQLYYIIHYIKCPEIKVVVFFNHTMFFFFYKIDTYQCKKIRNINIKTYTSC